MCLQGCIFLIFGNMKYWLAGERLWWLKLEKRKCKGERWKKGKFSLYLGEKIWFFNKERGRAKISYFEQIYTSECLLRLRSLRSCSWPPSCHLHHSSRTNSTKTLFPRWFDNYFSFYYVPLIFYISLHFFMRWSWTFVFFLQTTTIHFGHFFNIQIIVCNGMIILVFCKYIFKVSFLCLLNPN